MGFLLKFLLFHLCYVTYTEAFTKLKLEGYYWRDYEGTIPYDAVIAGTDKSGKLAFIGQVYFDDKIIPGRINAGSRYVHFELNGREIAIAHNVKILCTNDYTTFKWIVTNNTSLFQMTDKSLLIKGGYEVISTAYIGKYDINEISHIGKVMCSANDCSDLYTANEGETTRTNTFEVLSYTYEINNRV